MVSASSVVPIEIQNEDTMLTIHKLSTPSCIENMYEIQTYLIIEENDFQNWYFDIYNYLKHQRN